MHTRSLAIIGAASALLVLAACGSDNSGSSSSGTTAGAATTAAGAGPTTTAAGAAGGGGHADRNGDGKVTVGYVVAGDSKDGGFYQGQADTIKKDGQTNGWTVIVVDKVNPASSADTFQNLARQGADLIVGGGAELEAGLATASQADNKALYLLIADFPPSVPTYATAGASENQSHYLGGAAMGLVLNAANKDTACVVAGPELPFVKAMAANLKAGLAETAPNAKLLVTYTGDFENASLAKSAFDAQVSNGCALVYPYLGGALPAILTAAAAANVQVVGTSIDVCGAPGVPLSITYNPSFFLTDVLTSFENGQIQPGALFKEYGVDSNTGVGAKLCTPTADQTAKLEAVRAKIVNKTVNPDQIANG
jgi:basic membrane protein A